MKVKVFTASTVQEAMAQVKTDMGRDAVILYTRRLRKGGFLGFFTHEVVEVTAALESTAAAVVKKASPVEPVVAASVVSIADHTALDARVETTVVQSELAAMRKTLEQVLHKMPQANESLAPLFAGLLKNDVDPQIAENLLKGLADEGLAAGGNAGIVRKLLCERIASCFNRIEGIAIPAIGTKKVALIGATGVGKTTTIAKLAAHLAIKEGYRIALITSDTYRISAVEQLKTYADIIGVPLEVVYAPKDLQAALYRHQDKNLILLDTAGRSPNNQFHLDELQALLAVDPQMETHLVLNTTIKYKDAAEIINKFSICSPQKLLFTKVDEASNVGTILNILYKFPMTLSYITTGQDVPDDIELADAAKLTNLILRDL